VATKKYFDTTHWAPEHKLQNPALTAHVIPHAPRGGTDVNCCKYCMRAAKNKRLRTCEACGHHYCGRRACKASHTFACGNYRPHWKKETVRTKEQHG